MKCHSTQVSFPVEIISHAGPCAYTSFPSSSTWNDLTNYNEVHDFSSDTWWTRGSALFRKVSGRYTVWGKSPLELRWIENNLLQFWHKLKGANTLLENEHNCSKILWLRRLQVRRERERELAEHFLDGREKRKSKKQKWFHERW